MTATAISMGPMNQTWFGVGLMMATTGFLLVLISYGAYRLVSGTKLFKFCGSLGAFAFIIGLVLIGIASILPYY
jgi:hypothetical protein